MNKIEKIALSRIISDLIKSDSIIDSREMELWGMVKSAYGITKECMIDARFITFADAVNTLSASEDSKDDFLGLFRKITLADGMCNKDEALLMIALEYCFGNQYEADMIHVQVPQQGLELENSQIIYVESSFDSDVNGDIMSNYQNIENAMRLAGFNFAYIPQISQTYKSTAPSLFKEVLSFISPNIDDKQLSLIMREISEMTTERFCKEQLCRKLRISNIHDTYPAFLVKVGETICNDNIYANFLRFVIVGNVIEELKSFIYMFTSMMNSEYSILKNIYNSTERFIYSGVYKQIIDLYIMKENENSIITIDLNKQKICLPDIGEEIKVTRSEKALYTLILLESITGGLNLNMPMTASSANKVKKRLESIMNKYNQIYFFFGGDKGAAPDITDSTIRNPKISRINKFLQQLESKVSDIEEYKIKRTPEGFYRIDIDSSMIYSVEEMNTPILQAENWRRVLSM